MLNHGMMPIRLTVGFPESEIRKFEGAFGSDKTVGILA